MKARRRLAAAAGASAVSLLLLEAGLRLGGWTGEAPCLRPDASLRWTTMPDASGPGGVRTDARGFRCDGMPATATGLPLVVCLGDSCTFGQSGTAHYPARLSNLLAGRFAVVNAGVPGYSVLQGREYFRKLAAGARGAAPLKPAVVTVYFGWNDHWENADGRPDVEHLGGWRAAVASLRLFKLAKALRIRSAGGAAPPGPPQPPDPSRSRVPLGDYRAALEGLVRDIRAAGARPIVVAAPCGIDASWKGRTVPFAAGSRAPRPVRAEDFLALHLRYVEATREAAKASGAELVDIPAAFDDPASDPVHPNAEGLRLLAEALAGRILAVSAPPSRP